MTDPKQSPPEGAPSEDWVWVPDAEWDEDAVLYPGREQGQTLCGLAWAYGALLERQREKGRSYTQGLEDKLARRREQHEACEDALRAEVASLRAELEAAASAACEHTERHNRELTTLRAELEKAWANIVQAAAACAASNQALAAERKRAEEAEARWRCSNELRAQVAMLTQERDEARAALTVIEQASRGRHEAGGERWWPLREWLDARDIYNGDIEGSLELVAMVARRALTSDSSTPKGGAA